jgi:capreomycidine synthase
MIKILSPQIRQIISLSVQFRIDLSVFCEYNHMNNIFPSLLEEWLRDHYFNAEIDISSSGVENFSLSEIRQRINITQEELDQIFFYDSPTNGGFELRQAIAKRWGNGNPEQVMATNGSSEAIFLLMHALLQPLDEIVVIEPCYPALVHIAEAIGCSVKRWHLQFDEQFIPNLDKLKTLMTQQTRMVVVNFPHNPTGTSLSIEQQTELIKIVSAAGAYLIWDAAFAEITYSAPPLPDAFLLYEKAISLGTLSKAYGLPGLRVGWCLASTEVIERCIRLRDYTTICLSPLVEHIAKRVVEQADVILSLRRQQACINLAVLTKWLEQYKETINWVAPQGGVTIFPQFSNSIDTELFCRTLMRDHGVLLAPGTCFHHPNHVRLGFGGATANLEKGLLHLSQMLQT